VPAACPDGDPVTALGSGCGRLRRVRRILGRLRRNGCGQVLAVPGDRTFHGAAEVVPQMPAVGDLDRVRRPAGAPVGVAACPVPADQLRSGAAGQPGSEGVSRPAGQDVDRLAGLDIDQQGPVTVAAAQRELIDA
jgi:hypothetical protein